RPAIQVVVSADTLLGLDDQPAQLTGYGPITAQTARRLAADESGTWRRLLTDYATSSTPATRRARSRPATNPATAANTNTSNRSTKAARPLATTPHSPATGTT